MEKLKKWFFTFWIENYKVSFLFLFLIIVVGVISLLAIPKESNPDIKFGIISITTPYSWVNPEDMDSLITEKIEQEIEDIDGISKISSTSSIWVSSVWDTMTDIKDKVDGISFPTDADDPIVREISSSSELMFEALIYSEDNASNFSLTQKAKQMQSALEWKNGISSIDVGSVGAGGWLGDSASDASDYDLEVLVSKEKHSTWELYYRRPKLWLSFWLRVCFYSWFRKYHNKVKLIIYSKTKRYSKNSKIIWWRWDKKSWFL